MSMHSYISSRSTVSQAAELARLLADPTRLRIFEALFTATEDLCVNEIAASVGSSHSATSHQLAKLEARGVVECFREGQKMCYKLTDDPLVPKIKKSLQIFNIL